jgi:hypothetical protein
VKAFPIIAAVSIGLCASNSGSHPLANRMRVVGQTASQTAPTFYKDLLPILQDHCQSCHRGGEVAPMPLETYAQVKACAPAIAHAVEIKMMPPWFADPRYGHFANDPSLSEQQITEIVAGRMLEHRPVIRTMHLQHGSGLRGGIFPSRIWL